MEVISLRAPLITWVLLLAFVLRSEADEPIRLHSGNPHYFLWQGKPTVLITAGEHYGSVINLDFDYVRYLDALSSNRFNLTRVFSGTYREVAGSFNIAGNTLAPPQGRYVCPWARSETPGATDGGNKFDFESWDAAYFNRLKDFVTQAGERGVIVEIVLFCTMYDDAVWNVSPMNPRNCINSIGEVGRTEVYGGKNRALLAIQKAVVAKIVAELNDFDNVYFEICNEPYERGGLTQEWNDQIIATIVDTEAMLPKKHLIAQGFPPSTTDVTETHPRVSILNFHAASADCVRLNYASNRVIAFDETGGSDRSDRKYRTEGWDWILAGGGVYDHLDFSFTTDRPDGSAVPLPTGTPGGGGPELRLQLRILKEFIESFDFIRMKPDRECIKDFRITPPQVAGTRVSSNATARVLSEAGRSYAIYINGGPKAQLILEIPAGEYTVQWINTKSGQCDKAETFRHAGGDKSLTSPEYGEDIAVRLIRPSPK